MSWLTKVTEVGWKLTGTGSPDGTADSDDDAVGSGVADRAAGVPRGDTVLAGRVAGPDVWPAARGAWRPAGCCVSALTICGDTASPAMITAAPAAETAARRPLRRRAFLLTRSKVPGGGASGSTSWCSQASISSRGLLTVGPQGGLQPGPGVMQVRLDRSLRPAQHHRHLAHPEASVVVQQERAAQPGRQALDQSPDVNVLRRVAGGVRRGGGGEGADGPPFPPGLAPVIPDQVRGDHVQVALRVVQAGPAGQQPGKRLGGDLVCRLVVVDQLADPSGESRVAGVEKILGRGTVGRAEPGHRASSPRRRWRRNPRSERRRGVAEDRSPFDAARAISHTFYHTFRLARPRLSGPRCARTSLRRRKAPGGCGRHEPFPDGWPA